MSMGGGGLGRSGAMVERSGRSVRDQVPIQNFARTIIRESELEREYCTVGIDWCLSSSFRSGEIEADAVLQQMRIALWCVGRSV